MKKPSAQISLALLNWMLFAMVVIGLLSARPAMAANGTIDYFTAANPSGLGSPVYDMTNLASPYWNPTNENGGPVNFVSTDQATFGTNAGDAHYPPGTSFSLLVDEPSTVNGFVINSTNIALTLYGTENAHPTSANLVWWVTNYASLTENDTWSGGFNFNSETLTLAGGGTFTFQTAIGNNDNTNISENNAGGVVNLQAGNNTARSFGGGYILNSGTLNFAASAAATAFAGLTNKLDASGGFVINGGTVDNTSGSAMTLTIGSRGCTFGGGFTFTGSSSLNFASTPISLAANSAVTINANTLTLGGIISGSGFGLTELGGGTLVLSGVNTYSGNTLVGGGTLALTGSGSISQSALTVSNSTLDLSGLAAPAANPSLSLSNATVVISALQNAITNETATALNLGGTTNYVNVSSLPVITSYPARFPLISYTTLNGVFNMGIGSLPSNATPFGGYITNVSGLVQLVLTTGPAPARQLSWLGTDGSNPNNWDVQNSLNWQTNGGPPTTYNQGDIVTFSDSAPGQTNINLTTSLTPGIVTVSNNALAYNLGNGGAGGNGEISGTTLLTKEGTNVLILDEGGGNNFTGGLLISNGIVQVGLGDGRGSPGSGVIVDNGALVIDNSSRDSSFINDISGPGTITQEGVDTLQLAGTNTFSGTVFVVSNSTLQAETPAAFGGNPVTTVANGSVLDLNSNYIGGIVMAQGNGTGSGAVINSSANPPPANIGMTNLTLTGDTTVGTTGSRFDVRSPGSTAGNPLGIVLSTGGQPYNLTKTGTGGTGVFGLVSVNVDPFLANIDIQQGDVQMAGNTTGLGNPTNTLTIENGAEFELYAETNLVNKVFVFVDGGTVLNSSGVNTIIGPMNITNEGNGGDNYFDINGTSLVLSNTLTGNGIIFTETGTNTIFINGSSPNFAGGIDFNTISTIVIDGVLSNSLGVTERTGLGGGQLTVNGQLLGGEVGPNFPGAIAGNGDMDVTVDSSGPIFPGNIGTVGILTVSNLILDNSTVTFYVGAGTNSLIAVTNLTVNGNTLNIVPTGLLPVGAKYPIFVYSGTLTMNSSFSVNNSGGYIFTIDTSTQGVVNIVTSGGPPVWNGGSASDSDWSDSANWNGTSVQPGDLLYFGGTARLNNTNDTTANNTYSNIDFFANAGAFVLNGNPIGLGASISNNSASTQTFNLPLSFGSPLIVSPGPGSIIIGGGLTNTAPSPLTNYLTLTGTGILTNLLYSLNPTATNLIEVSGSNANWTLLDNPSSTPMSVPWALEISNGVFNFGSAGSAPTLTSLTIHNVPSDSQLGLVPGTATFNMTNGTLTLNSFNSGQSLNTTDTVNMAGGTFDLGPIGSVAADYYQGANGGNTGEVCVVNISGGIMNMGITTNVTGTFYIASRGNGTLNMTGSGTLNCATLDISRNAQGNTFGSIGVVNLSGGTLTANRIGTATANSQSGPATDGINPSATFNFNGGTLRAGANSATFYQGATASPAIPITSIVQVGGAIIDSSNFAITVLEPLQHDSTLGTASDGGLVKLGSGTLALAEANTYTGPTVVSNGTLAVNGSIGTNSVTVDTNATLAGTGTVGGSVTINNGGAIAPAGVGTVGTLTVSGSVSISGSAQMDINATLLTGDELTSSTSITYGGALTVTNLGGTLALGNSFTLFSAPTLSGSFTATNLPTLNPGLAWNWNPAAGTLSLVAGVGAAPLGISSISLSGQNVVINGTNSQAGTTYYLLMTTNLLLPINQWTPVSTNLATGSSFSFTGTNAVSAGLGHQFYILSTTNF